MALKKLKTENMFLLEILLEKVEIFPRSLPRELSNLPGETCVSLSLFNEHSMDLCGADFAAMKNGQSCLFALTPNECKELSKQFDINIHIFKKFDCPFISEKLEIGIASLSIQKEFKEIIQILGSQGNQEPITKTNQTTKTIRGVLPGGGCCIGELNMFIRMSCFGKNIITSFQMNLCENSVFFKDRDGQSHYKFFKPSGGKKSCKYPGSNSQMANRNTELGSDNESKECDPGCPGPELCLANDNYDSNSNDPDDNNFEPCGFPPCCFPACDIVVPPRLPDCDKMPQTILACGVEHSVIKACDATCGMFPSGYIPCEPPSCGEPFCPPQSNPASCFPPPCGPSPFNPPLCGSPSSNQPPCVHPPCTYPPCGYPPCGPPPCIPLPCSPPPQPPSQPGCSTLNNPSCCSPAGLPCCLYPYGMPPCGTSPCGLLENGEPPCGNSCSGPPYGVPPCKPYRIPNLNETNCTCNPPPIEMPSNLGGSNCSPCPNFPPTIDCPPLDVPCNPPAAYNGGAAPTGYQQCGSPCNPQSMNFPSNLPQQALLLQPSNPYPCGYSLNPVPCGKAMCIPKPCGGKCGNETCKDLLFCGATCGLRCAPKKCDTPCGADKCNKGRESIDKPPNVKVNTKSKKKKGKK